MLKMDQVHVLRHKVVATENLVRDDGVRWLC
jgi:hypothetical protein